MKYFPVANVEFTSELTDDEIIDRLSQELEPKKVRYSDWKTGLFMNAEEHRLLEGSMHNYHLKINRVVYNALIFNTVITGRFKQHAFNSSGNLTIRLAPMNGIFATIILIGFGVFMLAGIYSLFEPNPKLWYIYPTVLFIAAYAGMMLGFNLSVKKDVKIMSKLCDAQQVTIT